MNEVYLCLGGNLGDRAANLLRAIELISEKVGEVAQKSGVYETASWGTSNEPNYLNQVIKVYTNLLPIDLLNTCLAIEAEIGRTRNIKWENRLIDIDILFYGNEVISGKDLTVPHPYIQERKFVLVPLNEIAASFEHPVLKHSVQHLLDACKDDLPVKLVL